MQFDPILEEYAAKYEEFDRSALESMMPNVRSKWITRLVGSLNKVLPLFGVKDTLPASQEFTYEIFSILNMVSQAVQDAVDAGVLEEEFAFSPAEMQSDAAIQVGIGVLDALPRKTEFVTWLRSPNTKNPEKTLIEEPEVEEGETELSDEDYMTLLQGKTVR